MSFSEISSNSTSKIDLLRTSISETIINRTQWRYKEICSIDSKEALRVILQSLFPGNPHRVLRDFFIKHPICWTDLLRKLHKYRKNERETDWHIDEENIWDVYSSFLIRWRQSDIGEKLRNILPDAITKNQALLDYSSKQPSLLDEGWYSFSQIPKIQRRSDIKKMISIGMIKNIAWCTYNDIDLQFKDIYTKMLRYLDEIFWIDIPLSFCKNLDQLVKEIEKMFNSWSGEQRENAFRIIQTFHAWSSIAEIETIHNEAQSCIKEIPNILKHIGYKVENIQQNKKDDAIIYSWSIKYNNKSYFIEWRLKTIRSILQKMWETEEYTNIDAIRDIIGMAFIWPDNTDNTDKVDIISRFASLMSDFWYLLKDKGWLWSQIQNVEDKMKWKNKHPVHTTRKRWDSTDEKFKNTSLSGYIYLNGMNIWSEIQFYNNSFAEWKKIDDKRYKPRSTMSALMRWPKFATPRQCFMLLNKRVDAESLKELEYTDINAMLIWMIRENFLKPFVSENWEILLFTCNWNEKGFNKKFPSMQLCERENKYHQKMINYLKELGSATAITFSSSSIS